MADPNWPEWRSPALSAAPWAVVGAVFAFMLWIRIRAADRVIMDTAVFFSGNDPWYHARIVHLTVRRFPATTPFDPWSFFPYGTGRHSGFGGLFDQLIALGALVAGAGSPSPHLIDVITAYAPALFGAATVIPAYAIATRLTDRWLGLASAGLLALAGGQFLSRTIIGSADHQSAEAFFGTLAVLGVLVAVQTAYREKPTWVDVRDRNRIALRRPVTSSILGGVAVASYLMMWPPGVMIVFTVGIFVTIQLVRDHYDGVPPEYLAFGVATAFLTAGSLTFVFAKSTSLQATGFSLLQPLVVLGIAVGAVGLVVLSAWMNDNGYEPRSYPVAVVALLGVALLSIWVVFPEGLQMLRNLVTRIYSFGLLTNPSQLTVQEIQPATLDNAWRSFGAVFYLAVVGLGIMIGRVIRENRPTELLVVLWSLTIFSAYFTMIRFGYYLAVNVAILGAFAIWWITSIVLSIDVSVRDIADIEIYQVIGVIIILIAVIPGNVVAVDGRAPVWETSNRYGGTDQAWHDELTWLRDSTPPIPLEYEGRYEPPDDGDYDYPEGAYGVMSWWDYGHWITFQGQRIPNANPFQQGPRPASAYLQAQSEERANLILEALPSLHGRTGGVASLSDDELRSIIDGQSPQEAGEDTRYVMIDDQMVAGKFGAIATWTGPGYGAYISQQQFQVGDQQARLFGLNDRYRNTMMNRLYYEDARSLDHYRLVHESETVMSFASVAQQTPSGYRATNIINRRVDPGLFRAVQSRTDLAFYDVRRASRVKTFERVPGARLSGATLSENATTVYAFVQLRTNTGRNFTYVQSTDVADDGTFTMTIPYATTNEVGPADGGTDSGVVATGPVQVVEGNPFSPSAVAELGVPEPAIYDGRTIEVSLEPVEADGSGGEGGNATSIDAPRGPVVGTNVHSARIPQPAAIPMDSDGPTAGLVTGEP